MPYKVFVAGEEALAADANSFLMSQTVPRFTNAAQRTAQLAAPVLNQLSMLDSNPGVVYYWTGAVWAEEASPWTAYTPTLAGDTGASTLGNGTLVGRYAILGPKSVVVAIRFNVGTTTVFNAGLVRLGLPIAANTAVLTNHTVGPASVMSKGVQYIGTGFAIAATAVCINAPPAPTSSAVGAMNNTLFLAGDFVIATFIYEVA